MGQVISAPWVWLGCQVLQAGETFAAIQVGTDEGQNWSIDSQHPSVYHSSLVLSVYLAQGIPTNPVCALGELAVHGGDRRRRVKR